jgi:hypothetical protein
VALYLAFVFSVVLVGLSIVSVFIEIRFFSDYAFWIVVAAYVILAGAKQHYR